MAGHGRYPRFRLDTMPLDIAAQHVLKRIRRVEKGVVYVVPTSGVLVRSAYGPQPTDPERYRMVGTFTDDASLDEIAKALTPFIPAPEPVPGKACPSCGGQITKLRADGRPRPYCTECSRKHNRRYDRANRERRMAPVHRTDPLNLALRDMPGSRVSLLGIAGVRITEELRAA